MKKAFLILLLAAAPAAAQPVYTSLGEQRNVCKVTDGTDTADVTAAGRLQVDGSGVTQPVSGTVTANAGSGTFLVGDGSGPLSVDGTLTCNAGTGTLAVSGPLTDAQLRASAVPVSGTVTANQGGTWNVNNVAGTVSLPTGAATSANQSTEITSLQKIDNIAHAGSDVALVEHVPISGQLDDASTTTVTENQVAPVRITSGRALHVAQQGTATVAGSGTFLVGDGSGALTVDGTLTCNAGSGTLAVDTELPAAAALADNTANPTAPAAGVFLHGWDGSNWDRLQTGAAAGGALKVDGSAVTQPVSGTVTVTDGAGALNVIVDSLPTVTVTDGAGALNVIVDSGTITTTPPANASTNVAQLAGTATSVNSGNKDAGTLRVVFATDQPALTNKLLVTPDSVALPANQSTNVNQFGGSAVVTGTGAAGAGVPRVTFSNDSAVVQGTAAATTAGWPVISGNVARSSAAWTSATSIDTALTMTVTSYPMVAITVNTTTTITGGALIFESSDDAGTTWFQSRATRLDSNTTAATYTLVASTKQAFQTTNAGFTTFRVRLNPALTGTGTATVALLAGSFPVAQDVTVGQATAGNLNATVTLSQSGTANDVDVLTLPANASVNLAQVAGATVQTGNGTAAGVQRMSLASDSTGNIATIGTSVTPGTGAANEGKAEDAAAGSGDTGILILGHRNESATQLTSAANDYGAIAIDGYGDVFVRQDHNNRIRCTQTISTATTLTLVPSCTAPGAGLSIYITDISFSTNAAAIAADTFNTLKYGTGGACGTGTTVFWGAMTAAAVQANVVQTFATPIKIPANNEVCWMNSTAGSKFVVISGFIAP